MTVLATNINHALSEKNVQTKEITEQQSKTNNNKTK